MGAVFAGYTDNFAWGVFELDSGASLVSPPGFGEVQAAA